MMSLTKWSTIVCNKTITDFCISEYEFSLTCKTNIDLSLQARMAQWVRSLDYLRTHTSLSPIQRGFAPGFVNYKKWCTRLAVASDKAYQLLAHGRWFSPGTPASSTTKTGRHDIAEILLKVALKHKKINQSINRFLSILFYRSIKLIFTSTKSVIVYYTITALERDQYEVLWSKVQHYWTRRMPSSILLYSAP
jgi:hypothetical protein